MEVEYHRRPKEVEAMSDRAPEIDCNCDTVRHLRWDAEGEIVVCVQCGQPYLSTSDDLKPLDQ